MDSLLAEILAAAAPHRAEGKVADYIPALARVDPGKLGIAVADRDGRVWGAGDCDEPFSIQSISKVFMLALTLERVGPALWEKVGREPSGSAFNSIVQLESERGKPRNPLINPGAMVVTDHLIGDRDADAAIAPALISGLRGIPRSCSSWTIELNALPDGSRPTRFHRSVPTLSSASASMNTLEMDWIEKGSSQSPAPCTAPCASAKARPSLFGPTRASAGI